MADPGVRLMFCVLLVILIVAPDNGRQSFFFRFQKAERHKGGPQGSPKTRFASRKLLSACSHMLTWF